jgi:hypothetical protein
MAWYLGIILLRMRHFDVIQFQNVIIPSAFQNSGDQCIQNSNFATCFVWV